MTDRIDALESLLTHPGWLLFLDHAKEEWGPAACWRKARAAGADPTSIKIVDDTNVQVGQLLGWPLDEIARLKRAADKPLVGQGRGGYPSR